MSTTKLSTNVRRRAVFGDGVRVTKANGNDRYLWALRLTGIDTKGEEHQHITFCQNEESAAKTQVRFIKKHDIMRSTVLAELVPTTDNVWEPVGDGLDRFLYTFRFPTAEMSPEWQKEFSKKRRYLIVDETKYWFYIYILGIEYPIDKDTYEIAKFQGMGGPVFIGKQTK